MACQRAHWAVHKAHCTRVDRGQAGGEAATAGSGEASTSQQGSDHRSTPPSTSTTEAAGQAKLPDAPATSGTLHWTEIKIPPLPTSGTPQEMQAARKERQRVRRLYEAARKQAGVE